MNTFLVSAQPTTGFLVRCEPCQRPVRSTVDGGRAGDHLSVTCPDCSGHVMAQRIYGTVNRMECDPRCEGATGPVCSCACGGGNHGGTWIGKGTLLADELARYRAAQDKVAAKREAKRETERKRAASAFEIWATDNKTLIGYFSDHPASELGSFMSDMACKVMRHEILSPRMVEVAERIIREDAEREARDAAAEARKAEEARNAKPVPTGKAIMVTGTVVHTRLDESYHGYREVVTSKMLVAGDGWKIWSTIPRAIDDVNKTTPGNLGGLKGKTVTFTADVSLSTKDPDPSFGIAKRPRNAEIITEREAGA